MTLQQLRYIVAIAEEGTINEAAKKLFISQPSLTKAVKELEEEINIKIFIRTNKGVILSNEGDKFLGYARQVLEQANLLEERYTKNKEFKRHFSVSTQHYSFAVNAFIDVVKKFGENKYDFILRETQTNEIIEDVGSMKSEVGILYISKANSTVILRMIEQNSLKFEELFVAKPHVFISTFHPLAKKKIISMEDLNNYPYLSFEQGEYNSFHFSEEILSTLDREKNIKVRDRATLFNLLIGLNGYTVSTGIISKELNGENIISRLLDVDEYIRVGIITQKKITLSDYALTYIGALKKYLK
jgi:transcriptional regulator, lysR family